MLPISKIALFIEVILYHTEFQIYLNPHCLSYFYSNFEKGHIALDIKKGFVELLELQAAILYGNSTRYFYTVQQKILCGQIFF